MEFYTDLSVQRKGLLAFIVASGAWSRLGMTVLTRIEFVGDKSMRQQLGSLNATQTWSVGRNFERF